MVHRAGRGAVDAPSGSLPPRDPGRRRAAMRPAHRRVRVDRITDAMAIPDVWHILARAAADEAPRTSAAAQGDVVVRRYLPMTRNADRRPGLGQLAG